MKKYNSKTLNISIIFISIFFIWLVIFPILKIFLQISREDFLSIVGSPQFVKASKNSLIIASSSTIISILLALALAWIITRTGIKYKGVIGVFLTLPMLIPSISHGMGLIILLGSNGVVTNFLNLQWNIYGFLGIIIGSVMYSFPVAFLMLVDIFKYEDSSPYEAADVLGIPKWNQFKAITLAYIKKPLISIIFAVFAMIITDYGVPLMVGGTITTLPVLMYQEVVGLLNFEKGGVIGIFLLLPAVIAFLVDLFNKDEGNASYITKAFEIKDNKIRDILSYVFSSLIIILIILPIGAFTILTFTRKYPQDMSFTFNNIIKTFNMSGKRYLFNSITIALLVSVIGTSIAFATAYITARTKGKSSKFLHLISITSLAIPGIVLGLSYVLMFKESMIYGTLAILILVNIIHFFASPYLMMYGSLSKINENIESVGMTLGISRLRLIKDVFIPQTRLTILEMMSYFFVNSMMTISAVSFLATVKNKPISLMISQFESQTMLEAAAFISLIILGVNMVIKGIVYLIKRNINVKGC